MVCPKCDEGILTRIVFKHTGKKALLCDVCESLWFEGEEVKASSAHTVKAHSEERDFAYTIDDSEEKDQDHRPVRYTQYK